MNIVLVGGMDRLDEQYRMEAKRHGMEIQIFIKYLTGIKVAIF